MTTLHEFLQATTASAGARLITGPRRSGHGWLQRWVDFKDAEAVDRAIKAVESQADDVYFALGSFEATTATDRNGRTTNTFRRKQSQCVALRAFWLDLDVGKKEAPSYDTDVDAAAALGEFITTHKLPKPTYVVSSGVGLHVYWALTEDAPTAAWKPVAETLKALCLAHGLRADPTRTADQASVLRPPTTLHKKSGNRVEILVEHEAVSFAAFSAALATAHGGKQLLAKPAARMPEIPAAPFVLGEMNFGMETTPKSFANLIGDNHCPQIQAVLQAGGNVQEPLWRAALSIVQHCDADSQAKKEQWIELLSDGHPEFNMDAALVKAAGCDVPNGCGVFKQNNPAGCAGCRTPQIGNPIKLCFPPAVLAKINGSGASKDTVPAQQQEGQTAEVPLNEYNDVTFFEDALKVAGFGVGSTDENLVSLPRGYFYGAGNRICRRLTRAEAEKFDKENDPREHIEVCPVPIFAMARVRAEHKQTFGLSIRAVLPHDGAIDRELPLAALNSERSDKLAELIGNLGVTVNPPTIAEVRRYLSRFNELFLQHDVATNSVEQLGWDTSGNFVLPGTLISTKGEDRINVPHDKFKHKQMAGTKEGWNAILKQFYSDPNDAAYQFVLAVSLGSPLVSFGSSAESAGVLSLFSHGSGAGKTTLANFAASIYGSPNAFRMQGNSTSNSVHKTLGVANSLPVVLDEISSQDDEWINNLVYSATAGQEKSRMNRNAELSDSKLHWSAPTITTANKSVLHVARSYKGGGSAVPARVLEIDFSQREHRSDVDSTLMHKIEQNHGVVGHEWITWLVNNRAAAIAEYTVVGQALARKIRHDARSRYHMQLAQVAVTAARLTARLGIVDLDAAAVEDWIVAHVSARYADDVGHADNTLVALTDFINYARQDIVITGSGQLGAAGSGRTLAGRLDKPKGQIAISRAVFRAYCDHRGLSYTSQVDALHRLGMRNADVRLNAGIAGAIDTIAIACFAMVAESKAVYEAVFGTDEVPAVRPVNVRQEAALR